MKIINSYINSLVYNTIITPLLNGTSDYYLDNFVPKQRSKHAQVRDTIDYQTSQIVSQILNQLKNEIN